MLANAPGTVLCGEEHSSMVSGAILKIQELYIKLFMALCGEKISGFLLAIRYTYEKKIFMKS